jgi:hypothetical protein
MEPAPKKILELYYSFRNIRGKFSPSAAAVWTVVGEYIYSPTTPILQQWGDFGRVAYIYGTLPSLNGVVGHFHSGRGGGEF